MKSGVMFEYCRICGMAQIYLQMKQDKTDFKNALQIIMSDLKNEFCKAY